MKQRLKSLLSLLLLAASIAGAYNVMSDNADVEKLAMATACESSTAKPCKPQTTMMARNPIGQTFELADGARHVRIRCARQLVLVGDYRCTLE